MGGFNRFQYTTHFNWWYAFLPSGSNRNLMFLITPERRKCGEILFCIFYAFEPFKFEMAKGMILIEKLLVAGVFLALLISISNIISPATAVYSVPQSITGSITIVIASVWQIPLCLYLARKTGLFVPIMLNTVLGIFLPILLGNTAVWWLVPYCWAAKLAWSRYGN